MRVTAGLGGLVVCGFLIAIPIRADDTPAAHAAGFKCGQNSEHGGSDAGEVCLYDDSSPVGTSIQLPRWRRASQVDGEMTFRSRSTPKQTRNRPRPESHSDNKLPTP